jgi:putative ABC transport system ATP-binding protein
VDGVTTAVLHAVGLHRFFHVGDDETAALRDVSVDVAGGEMVAVVGPSGSGKSTLLAVLSGIEEPDAGFVEVDGHRLTRRSESERARLRARLIGVLFQASNLIEHLSVEDNLRLAQRLAGSQDAVARELLLDELGLLPRRRARPTELSGGEAARAGLAVALINDPDVVLADEPTGEVDGSTGVRVLDLLCQRAQRGVAIMVVTHSAAVSDRCDRVCVLRDGRLVA